MSIVIAMMFPNGVVAYADKRAVTRFADGTTITKDDFLKIHKIRETVVCGITGSAERGLLLVSRLSAANLTNPSDMIEFVKSYPHYSTDENFGITVTMGGIYDNGKPFLWTYRGDGITTFEQEGVKYSIATDPEDLGQICGSYLERQLQDTSNIHQALQNVVKFAATKNPVHISPEYDKVVISL